MSAAVGSGGEIFHLVTVEFIDPRGMPRFATMVRPGGLTARLTAHAKRAARNISFVFRRTPTPGPDRRLVTR